MNSSQLSSAYYEIGIALENIDNIYLSSRAQELVDAAKSQLCGSYETLNARADVIAGHCDGSLELKVSNQSNTRSQIVLITKSEWSM